MFVVLLASCSAVPGKTGGFQREFAKPADAVKQAGMDALIIHGFEITKKETNYIEGYRPRIWGFFCSPGGETSGIWLEQINSSLTRASVTTAISSFGRLCQKNWTNTILAEMEKSLAH